VTQPLLDSALLTPAQAAAVDAPAAMAAYTRWVENEEGRALGQSRLLLGGLHCAACAGLIEAALQHVPGVLAAEVQGAAQRASVTWDPARTRPSRLLAAVRQAGYEAYPDTGAQAVAQAERESRRALWQLFVAAFCMMQIMMYATPSYVAAAGELSPDMAALLRWASWLLCLPVLLFAAGPFLRGAWRSLRAGRIGMDVPVALGIGVTFVASSIASFQAGAGGTVGASGEVYFDSLSMFVTFLLAARLLESRARRRAAQSLDAVMRRLPDAAEVVRSDGSSALVTVAELALGDHVRVPVGQAFAADGVLLQGRTQVDEAMLSGESCPRERGPGDEVSAGCLNVGAPVLMEVRSLGEQTRYQRIVALVERALTQRPALLRQADRLAGPFLWGVLALAAGSYGLWQWIDPSRAVWVAVSVLIVTCPCALSLGAPVALLASAGALARRGILVQRLDALEALTRVRHMVFDKTGTLTRDRLERVARVGLLPESPGDTVAQLPLWAQRAAGLAALSQHPLAQSLCRAEALEAEAGAASAAAPAGTWVDAVEQPGQGVQATWQPADAGAPQTWRLGAAGWCGATAAPAEAPAGPAVWLGLWTAADPAEAATAPAGTAPGRWQACLRCDFEEALRPDAATGIATLRAAGLTLHLLSGDQPAPVQLMAARLGLHQHRAACTPQDKLEALAALQATGDAVAMVGDGINDAPVLARADVSIALGSAAALAQARSDVIILTNRIGDVAELLRVAERTVRIVRQNLAWAVAYNLACVPLALVGWLPPWAAGIGMALSSLCVVLNALRLTRTAGTPPADRALPLAVLARVA
jgi:P-type Cu2+ transporter